MTQQTIPASEIIARLLMVCTLIVTVSIALNFFSEPEVHGCTTNCQGVIVDDRVGESLLEGGGK